MSATSFSLFDTPIGSCAVAWGGSGLCGVALPEGDRDRTIARLLRRHAGARDNGPPEAVADAIRRIIALLEGRERDDFGDLHLDMAEVAAFDRGVYAAARAIGPGQTTTYGALAGRLGDPRLARAVGQALGRNPFPIIVPCHRILAAGGRLGGFSARGGTATKLRLLQIEEARTGPEPLLFDQLSAAASLDRPVPDGAAPSRNGPAGLRFSAADRS